MTLAAVLGLTVQAQSQSSSSQSSQSSQQDTSFITQAAQGNLAEVELGKLGAQKSQNQQIKQLSQHLQTDHQKANQQLQPIAQSKGLQLPQQADAHHTRQLTQLQKLSGAEFDRQFATTALQDHARTLALFQREAQQGQDPATKQYAQSLVPALQHHLTMAQQAAKSVGVSDTTISSILSRYPGAVGGAGSPGGQQQGAGSSQSGYEGHQHMHDMQK
ncbi:MAG TPA: DUF4142 domain-containing protein [Candidatus Sulfotelmatobacter sp.]|nr:DUF4142 domain-containing protein [Candidatus Sulfotelmatobacter sp.]